MKNQSVYNMFRSIEDREKKSSPQSVFSRGNLKARKICKCGTCKKCEDNAKWERIFQEKFASKTSAPERSLYGCALGNIIK